MIATVAGSDAFRAVHEARPTFRAFVARAFGDEGRRWLAALPDLTAAAVRRFGLVLGDELPGGSLSYVAAATTADGRDVVLKLGGPWASPADEARALERWAGDGAVALLDLDGTCALLLERVRPGRPGARVTLQPSPRCSRGSTSSRSTVFPASPRRRARGSTGPRSRAGPRRRRRTGRVPQSPASRPTRPRRCCSTATSTIGTSSSATAEGSSRSTRSPASVTPRTTPATGCTRTAVPGGGRGSTRSSRRRGLPRDRVRDWAAVVGVHG